MNEVKGFLPIHILKEKEFSEEENCPYFPERKSRNEFMLATDLSGEEFNELLKNGWRRFGIYFFRPNCKYCNACIPIRIPVNKFMLSKSQRRVQKKNKDTKVIVRELSFHESLYDLYEDHSKRFDQESSRENFIQTFFHRSVPAIQTEYYVNEKLSGFGFIDIGKEGASSVYFVFGSEFSKLSIGTFGVIKEIEISKNSGLDYYYLGYYLEKNKHMKYKNSFKPYELYDWGKDIWVQY
ncbi:MAG: arginyltransferase [Deltaproteobacteria bacterium]|nr:arginyltransferase [Deltaproteobacteria bacterium]